MNFISPSWPAPKNVRSLITTRKGGGSQGQYAGFNLAGHVGDNPADVEANRRLLVQQINRPVQWIRQVHGCDVLTLDDLGVDGLEVEGLEVEGLEVEGLEVEGLEESCAGREADAVTSTTPGTVCAVQTADCLPLLICDRKGTRVAAVHAGWRGLADGIITNVVRHFADPGDLLVYLGPGISQQYFQVGEDVLEVFRQSESRKSYAEPVMHCFAEDPLEAQKYRADLYRLARSELNGLGVEAIFGGGWCTYAQNDLFYSFRRDGVTGRMASLIWLAGPA